MSRDLYRFSCAMDGSVTEADREACLHELLFRFLPY